MIAVVRPASGDMGGDSEGRETVLRQHRSAIWFLHRTRKHVIELRGRIGMRTGVDVDVEGLLLRWSL
jgi:hypothetical protein